MVTDPRRVHASLESLTESLERSAVVSGIYRCHNPDNEQCDLAVLYVRTRGEDSVLFAQPHGTGWVLSPPRKPLPIYNRANVRTADRVVVVSDEKGIEALHGIGVVSTTCPGGIANVASEDWSLLAGKAAVLWPANERQSRDSMRELQDILERLSPPARVSLVNPNALGLPEKASAATFVAGIEGDAAVKRRAVLPIFNGATPTDAAEILKREFNEMIAGKRCAVSWPWRRLGNLTQALLPGTITLLCGPPGSGKSLLLLEAFVHWHANGVSVALLALEESREYHLHRILAQLGRDARLLFPDWVKTHRAAETARNHYAPFLRELRRSLWEAPKRELRLPDIATWIEARAREGRRLIAVDPVTVAAVREPWVEDLAFLQRVQTAIEPVGASVILVSHPRKGRRNAPGLDELSGGAAYQRFSQTVLWIESHATRSVTVGNTEGREDLPCNRTLHLLKSRNGKGAGLKLGYLFDSKTLRFLEQGLIVRSRKSDPESADGTELTDAEETLPF